MSEIGVVYIARGADPNWQERFTRFVASYLRHPPGIVPAFYITYKAFASPEDLSWARDQFIVLNPIEIFDDVYSNTIGFVDAANLHVIESVLCPLNSSTEIMYDDWLKKLYDIFSRSEVGLVGCTGSRVSTLHIRDTAILVDRIKYLTVATQFDMRHSKDRWLMFEHGPNNLTQQILRAGKKVFVVEKDRVIAPEEWPSPTTYQGNLQNVLVHDRGARDFRDL
jgi:hypothetical protein